MAHQARADLREVSPEFQSRIEVNSNTILVSGVKDTTDAEYYSGMLGTRSSSKETTQKREGLLGKESTGVKSVREVEEFVLHPNVLKTLDQGQLFAISRIVDPQWRLVKVTKAPEFTELTINNQELMDHLKKLRASYQYQEDIRYLDLGKLKKTTLAEKVSNPNSAPLEAWN